MWVNSFRSHYDECHDNNARRDLDTIQIRSDNAKFLTHHKSFEQGPLVRMLPSLFQFLHWVEKERTGRPIAFLSRDCYHLITIFQKMYPNTPCAYVACSRKACRRASASFTKYIGQYSTWCFVDLNGTGRSFSKFWSQCFGHVPQLLMYCFTCSDSAYEADTKFFTNGWKQRQMHPEKIMAAPHRSIVDVDERMQPVYDSIDDEYSGRGPGTETFIRKFILDTVGPHTSWYGVLAQSHNCALTVKAPEDSIPGIEKGKPFLALDIDGTTLCKNMSPVAALVHKYKKRYNIVIITGRKDPVRLPLREMGLTDGCPIFYNSGGNHDKIPEIKQQHLVFVHRLTGLNYCERHLSVLVDNEQRNIDAAQARGFTGILATCDTIGSCSLPPHEAKTEAQ